MKKFTINEAEFIYGWYDKDTERFYKVVFTEKGDIAGGYSYFKGEDDPGIFQETCAKVGWEKGVLMFEKFLKEDEKKSKVENIAIPESCFKAEK